MLRYLVLVITCLLLTAIGANSALAQSNEPIQPLPTVSVNAARAALGKRLFFETRLSVDDTMSCGSCHDIDGWGAENTNVSEGVKKQLGDRNSPTVFNSVFNFKQFWDGRADDLSHQAMAPVTNPVEMGMVSWDDAIKKLKSDKTSRRDSSYRDAFMLAYSADMSKELIVDAIAEYEKTLVTPNAPFDKYLRGESTAISANQKKGYELFKSYGCVACHQGANVGGNMFQKFGVLKDINMQDGSLSEDLGRYTVTKNEWDKRVFKVPSLRLAVKTPPYFHNGSVKTIEEAVDIMIQYQLGRGVPSEDRDSIIDFLGSLVGEKPQGAK
jgi:cytochrome c peroxidase